MTVYIQQDGSLANVEITKPSSHAVLNLAAARIVQLAAPFAPLPASIAQNTDIFAITRTWHFEHQTLTTHSPCRQQYHRLTSASSSTPSPPTTPPPYINPIKP